MASGTGNSTGTISPVQDNRSFWIGRQHYAAREHIGGCPYGQTLHAFSRFLEVELFMLLPCKRWGCEHCGRVRAADLSRRIVEAAPTKFITLTVANNLFESPRAAYDATRRQLPKWSAKVRKQLGTFEYCRVLEVTAAGWPHYHLLARCPYIPQATLSAFWGETTGSKIVDVRQIKNGQNSVNYVCKYLRKQKYCPFTNRRVSWTKGFFPDHPKTKRDDWQLEGKEHSRLHPSEAMFDRWGECDVYQVGPYAWTKQETAQGHWARLCEKRAQEERERQTTPDTSSGPKSLQQQSLLAAH